MNILVDNEDYEITFLKQKVPSGLAQHLTGIEFDGIYTVRVVLNRAPEYVGEDPEAELEVLVGEAVAKKFNYEVQSETHQILVATVTAAKEADALVDAVRKYHKIVHSEEFKQAVAKKQAATNEFQQALDRLL